MPESHVTVDSGTTSAYMRTNHLGASLITEGFVDLVAQVLQCLPCTALFLGRNSRPGHGQRLE